MVTVHVVECIIIIIDLVFREIHRVPTGVAGRDAKEGWQ